MAKKQRALTPAELRRKERFDQLCEELRQQGYAQRDLTIGMVFANVAAIFLMLPFAALLWLWYVMVNSHIADLIASGGYLAVLLQLILLTVLHEGIHGLTWGFFAKRHLRAISFGVIWRYLTPYCACAEPLKRWQYLLGAAMPTLLLGFGLGAIAVALARPFLLLLATIMIFGGGGDFCIILKILLTRPAAKDALYCDHPCACGAVVFEKRP